MTATTGKTLSMGLVGVMVGYCCWPYVFGPDQGPVAPPSEAPPAIAASALRPSIDPAPDRDPFRVAARAQAVAEASATKAHDDAQAESESAAGTEARDASSPDDAGSLGTLALNATFVRGDQRVALINGRVYAPGEPLADSESLSSPFVVSEIFADRVVIERRGQTTELGYSDLDSATPAPRANAKVPNARPPVATKRQSTNHGSSPPKRASNGPSPKGPQRP